jgi:hypothetical protein
MVKNLPLLWASRIVQQMKASNGTVHGQFTQLDSKREGGSKSDYRHRNATPKKFGHAESGAFKVRTDRRSLV